MAVGSMVRACRILRQDILPTGLPLLKHSRADLYATSGIDDGSSCSTPSGRPPRLSMSGSPMPRNPIWHP
jgi:hypothetical protein